MFDYQTYKTQLEETGFAILPLVFPPQEIHQLITLIDSADESKETFCKSTALFAIRQFLKEIPTAKYILFNEKLKSIIHNLFGENYFVVKSIYFDKPETSNWFVSYHQDLTISVDQKSEITGFNGWSAKQDQFSVQPPLEILQNIFTVRIHLDDTNAENGALKVIPGSHAKGIYRPETIDWSVEKETICEVPAGGIMIMKPLLLHGSNRTTNKRKRRVVHIEFSNYHLPQGLNWAEKELINSEK